MTTVLTPEEHAKICKEVRVVKAWSATGKAVRNPRDPANPFRVRLHTRILACGHRVVTSEKVKA